VDNILEIDRMQAGEPLRLSLTQFSLVELIRDAVDLQLMQAADKEVDIFVGDDLADVCIEGDKLLLMRVLTNLLSNGVKYTPKGGSISVTLVPQSTAVEIGITDTGYGIPTNELANIFKPFYRVPKHEHQARGTGLGLAIVKHYVEAHQGRIIVDSHEGRGSIFSIQLPLIQTK
jgi:two-component system phosphate regulon sensor histidine kinase PhoR